MFFFSLKLSYQGCCVHWLVFGITGSGFCDIQNNQGIRLITLTATVITPDITKTECNNCLKENKDKHTVSRKTISRCQKVVKKTAAVKLGNKVTA